MLHDTILHCDQGECCSCGCSLVGLIAYETRDGLMCQACADAEEEDE